MKPLYWRIVDVVIVLALGLVSGIWFTWHHAFGAYGDDSPGYIYSAHQLLIGDDLVQQDPLVQTALDYFGSEPYARFVAPAHHEIISPSGWIASRYPIGLSLLMAGMAKLIGDTTGIYLVVPLLAVMVVLLTYLGAIWVFPLPPVWKRLVGLGSACIVIGSNLFANNAVAQPMREIPSMAFILLAFYGLVWALKHTNWKLAVGLIFAGALFGWAVGIRETTAILLIPFTLYGVLHVSQRRLKTALWFVIGCVLGYAVFIVQAVDITWHKEAFRDKDVTRIAVTANFDHIQSLAIHNLWDNQGKFKPGVGGLQQYWEVMQQFSPWFLFLPGVLLGLVYCWYHQRNWFWVLGSWLVSVVGLFGMWINPYARYILPILPIVAWLSVLGVMYLWELFIRKLQLQRFTSSLLLFLVAVSFVVAYQPSFAAQQERLLSGLPIDRELTKTDLEIIQANLDTLLTDSQTTGKPPMLLMLGETKGGLAETIMTHSNVRVIRFPNKDKEQPPYDQLTAFLDQLEQTNTLYLWYDPSVTALEQRYYNEQTLQPVATFNTSFASNISILRIIQ
jgi:hypothetical protein